MPTRTTPRLKKSPDTNDRHLQAVPDLTPSLGERVDARIRDNGGDPRKVRRAGKVAGLLLAAGLASGALAVSVLPAGSKDARTELHQDQERNLMDAFLTSGKTEMRVGNAEVTRLAGSIRITPDPTEHVNMRSTLARQNFDPRNPGENWDSNADV